MNYNKLNNELKMFIDVYYEVGQLPQSMLKFHQFPDEINQLIIEDVCYFKKVVDFFHRNIRIQADKNIALDKAIESLNIISNTSTPPKKKYLKYSAIILKWLLDNNFFDNIYENGGRIDVTAKNIIDYKIQHPNKIDDQIIRRINQQEAYNLLRKNGLETGIHCQATGCGKTFIILDYIEYIRQKIKNPKIILFTERVSILADLFQLSKTDKTTLIKDNKNIKLWKDKGICDLTTFNIINLVTVKNKEWSKLFDNSNKPTLLIINRAYLTSGKKIQSFKKKCVASFTR